MAINLQQHGTELLNAFNSVLNPNDSTNWAIFSYEGKSNVLKVGETGEDGLEELSTSFNSGKVQYAVTTVECPATKQPKVVLIQWQGDGVPATQLGSTASHVHEVKKFFKGIHLTLHARCEDDVEPDVILKAVHKVTSTLTSSATQGFVGAAPTGPIGSVYKPTVPTRDINSSARQQFWSQVEKDDTVRRNDEQSRLKAVNEELENERKRMADRLHVEQEHTTAQYLEGERQKRNSSDQSRLERLADARDAIGSKGANLKSMWEEKGRPVKETPNAPVTKPKPATGNGAQMQSRRQPSPPPVAHHDSEPEETHDEQPSYYDYQPEKKIATAPSLPKPAPKQSHDYQPEKKIATPPSLPKQAPKQSHEEEAPAYYGQPAPPPPAPTIATPFVPPPRRHQSDDEDEQQWDEDDAAPPPPPPQLRAESTTDHSQVIRASADSDVYQDIPDHHNNDQDQQAPLPVPVAGKGAQAVALWDYQATDDTELTFDPNDVICHIEQVDPGWWRGEGPDGKVGLFPANYVQMLE